MSNLKDDELIDNIEYATAKHRAYNQIKLWLQHNGKLAADAVGYDMLQDMSGHFNPEIGAYVFHCFFNGRRLGCIVRQEEKND